MRCAASPSHSALLLSSPFRRGGGEGAARGRGFSARGRHRRRSPCDFGARSRVAFPARDSSAYACALLPHVPNKTRVDGSARSIDRSRSLAGRSIQTTAVPVAGALRSPSSVFSSSSFCRRGCLSTPFSAAPLSAVVARARFSPLSFSRACEKTAETLFISTGSERARARARQSRASVCHERGVGAAAASVGATIVEGRRGSSVHLVRIGV